MSLTLISVFLLLASVLRIVLLERRSGAYSYLAVPFFAIAVLELFDFFALGNSRAEIDWKRCALFVEALLPSCWILLSLTYARELPERGLSLKSRLLVGISALLVLVPLLLPAASFYYAPDFPAEAVLFLADAGYYFYVAILLLLVVALINFESTLVNASSEALWRVKLDIVALCSMLAVLAFYYSSALLYRSLNMELAPLRSLLFIIASLMLLYARSHWRGSARVKVSQAVLLKSVVIVVISAYLVMLGALGEAMKYFGPLFPRVLTLSLGFIAGILLLLLLLSDRAKRELKVLLHKHFYQSKYDYRAQWLGLTERLSTFEGGDDLVHRVLLAYCEIFGVHGAALYQHQQGCGWYCVASALELEPLRETINDDNPILTSLRERQWVFCSGDPNHELTPHEWLFLERYGISFVVPLFEGEALSGFIVLGAQVVPDEQYRYEDFDLMKTIARQVSVAMQHQRLSEQLTQSKAMEAVGSLATFVVHDLKNLAATISLVLENAREHIDNPEFQQDMLSSLGNTTKKMHHLIGRLRNLGESELLQRRPVDLLALTGDCAAMVQGRTISVQGDQQVVLGDREELQKVLLNLLLNAVEASPPGASITVEVGCNGTPFVKVADRGCGMSPRFIRNDLFVPFRTSKPTGLGIGLYQSRQIVTAHGGSIEVSSVEGEGTVFTVHLPVAAEEPAAGAIEAA
ncbi:XrtA/PEP-CTERM system histidine kinase PrsK [Geomonas subterranea]|uniref:histidine kinase n=1 Tax=Geomonas subterranea TaxID=2847989 RepID=A0ABX8LI10_9BACT|nr:MULTISPECIES: XrtA/PEP-CTERM system histidine kinase PrsK [Geomonas]QXE91683.1 PEP-CTERM system histidine kinase PrsK [Geomonas subterranea]QXM10223.1 PEP-CTERM system histidine kinase PrsK [Geomonas subterranea]